MTVAEILKNHRKIAVVGLSPRSERPSHYVTEYMLEQGYEIVGVNPGQTEILGRPCYPNLAAVPGNLEIVAIFRSSEFLEEIVDEALSLPQKPKVLWIQLGIENARAEARAEKAGLTVVRQRCMMVEHRSLK